MIGSAWPGVIRAVMVMMLMMMMLMSVMIVVPVDGFPSSIQHEEAIGEQYCQFEFFNVSCAEGHVILLTTARYGRMRLGRCATDSYKLGCEADVLRHMDSQCSGHRSCTVRVSDLEQIASPCNEMKCYLEASYLCVPVSQGEPSTCNTDHQITLSAASGYISSELRPHSLVGTKACPWTVSAPQGQSVRLELFSFLPLPQHESGYMGDNYYGYHARCPMYLTIEEYENTQNADDNTDDTASSSGADSRSMVDSRDTLPTAGSMDVSLCEMSSRRRTLYVSQGNTIRLSFMPTDTVVDTKFLLYYSPYGCPNLSPVPDSTMHRDGDNVVIKCNRNKETAYLTCTDNQWIGDVVNCTAHAHMKHEGGLFNKSASVSHSLIMAVIVGIVLGVLVGSILLAVVFMCKKKHHILLSKKKDSRAYILSGSQQMTSRQSSARSSFKACPYSSKPYLKQSTKSLDKTSHTDHALAQQARPLINNNQLSSSVDSRGTPTAIDYPHARGAAEDYSASSTPPFFTPTPMAASVPDYVGRAVADYPESGRHHTERSQSRCEQPTIALPVYFELDPSDQNSRIPSAHAHGTTSIDNGGHVFQPTDYAS